MNDTFPEDHDFELPSKSELKRQMHALQALGERIVKLTEGQLKTIPLDGTLEEAIMTARRIKSHEGLRRQMQYIGKLLRDTDTDAIERAFAALEAGRKAQTQRFHELEQWRDRLVEAGPKAIEEVVERYPTADRQHLRQLVMQAGKEQKQNKPPASARKLFRYLRELDES
jgi:ribosome-associated protein